MKIAVGLVIGAALGIFVPQATAIGLLGTLFVGALKAIAPVLVFFMISGALARAGAGLGRRFTTVIFLYLASTLLAAITSVFASFLFPVTIQLDVVAADNTAPNGLYEVMTNLLSNLVKNPIGSLADGNYMGILFWSILAGIALKKFASQRTIEVIGDISECVSKIVGWIIQTAPFGILGIVFTAVSENGLAIFADYGLLLAVLVGTMLFVALVINPILVAIFTRKNPYPLVFRCLRESGLTALFTRSSAANIPVNMALCEKLGLDRDFYSVSIPLGSTINMDGAAVTITVLSLATAHTLGLEIPIPVAILLSIVATLGACGASGVAGGSLLLIPMACSLLGISNEIAMQVVAIGFIFGVVQDSVETALNSSGDVLFTATAEFHDRLKHRRAAQKK